MKIGATLLAATVALSMVPFASASTDLYTENLTWMTTMHPHADVADLEAVSYLAAQSGISFANPAANTQAAGVGGVHVGEIWGICQDVTWFFGGANPPDCSISNAVNTGIPCFVIAAHWAAFIWFPASVSYTNNAGGTPAFSVDVFWTEGHAGVGPLSQPHAGFDFTGSGCYFSLYFSSTDNFAISYGDGVAMF